MDAIHHPNGKPQSPKDYEVKNLRLVPDVKCDTCGTTIKPDRIRWFAVNRKGQIPKLCGNCAFFHRADHPSSSR